MRLLISLIYGITEIHQSLAPMRDASKVMFQDLVHGGSAMKIEKVACPLFGSLDVSKAKQIFNWQPKITFKELVKIMIDADLRSLGLKPIGEGDEILKKKFPDRWWRVD